MRCRVLIANIAMAVAACTTTSPRQLPTYRAQDIDVAALTIAGESIPELVDKPIILTGETQPFAGPTPVIEVPHRDASQNAGCLVLVMEPAKKRKLLSATGKQVVLSGHFQMVPVSDELLMAFAYRSIKFDLVCNYSMDREETFFYVDRVLSARDRSEQRLKAVE